MFRKVKLGLIQFARIEGQELEKEISIYGVLVEKAFQKPQTGLSGMRKGYDLNEYDAKPAQVWDQWRAFTLIVFNIRVAAYCEKVVALK
jgi:hypothetical protein